MKPDTPAKRLHALAAKNGFSIREFSPGIRIWTIRPASDPYAAVPLAFGVPHSWLADKIRELRAARDAAPIYATRADLAAHPAFADLDTDDDGNPLVWENHYCCQSCTSESVTWQEAWSCQCDAHCPECDAEHSAEESVWLGPDDPALITLWENLPEAG